MQGSRPYTIEKKILEKDVRKFLHEDLYAFQIRSVHYKNWLKKQCDKTRKFIEKHKEAIIIGALVVVAVVAVAATVIAVTAAPPIAAIALNFDTPESELSKHDSAAIRNSPQTLEDTINDYQNSINENDFYENNEKIMESALFQKDIYEFPIDTYDKIIAQEHIKTNDDIYNYRAPFFIDKSNASESFYYLQGHEDLKGNYYDKAIYNFDKALELNPNNHDLYLDRAFAYLKASEFNRPLV